MATEYTYKIEKAEVRLVHDDKQYKILVSEIDFSQTFQEKSFPVKTIHNQSSFEGSSITRANPAEFSLNTALPEQNDHRVLFDRLLDSAAFDLYISTTQDVWKLETCVIQEGTFQINRSRPLRMQVSGEASKLSKHSGTIPGTVQSISDITYIIPTLPALSIGGTDISDCVTAIQTQIQNDIQWNKNDTIHSSVNAVNADTSIYPTNFINGTRIVAGSITRYYKNTNADTLTWNEGTSLRLRAGASKGKTVTSFTVSNGGSNYTSAPDVTVSGGGGSGATGTATISGGEVTAVSVGTAGIGYSSPPTVTVSGGGGNNAVVSAVLSTEPEIRGIDFNITNCSFTNRLSTADTFTEQYNWRMTQNPTALSDVITYTTN